MSRNSNLALAFTIGAAAAGAFIGLNFVAANAQQPELSISISAQTPPPLDVTGLLASVGATDVTIDWTSEDTANCGATGRGLGGCFSSQRPNIIVISPELTGDNLAYVLLHEYAHVTQHRAGKPLDECEADQLALSWGAKLKFAQYLPNC